MNFSINYTINNKDLRSLELISQANGNLQVLRMNPNWAILLERQAKIKEAIGSIGIEGTVLSLNQAQAITIGDKKIEVGEKERREFTGYYESLDHIKNKIDINLSKSLLLEIHGKITVGDKKAFPGKIRMDQNYIESKGKIIYTPPPPEQLSKLLDDFISWFNKTAKDKDFSPVVAAAICHFWFVWIHPFADGNGRVGRLLTTFLLLKKESEGIKYFALSDYYNQDKDTYYDALEDTNKCNPKIPSMNFDSDLTTWVRFFIKSYNKQMKEVRSVTNRILQLNIRVEHLRNDGLITETHNKALSFLSSREKTSYKELREHLEVSGPRINQILKPLREANILIEEKIGKEKWFALGAPEIEPDETIFNKKLKSKKVDNIGKDEKKSSIQATLPIFN